MSLSHQVQNEDPDEVVTLWPDATGAVAVPDSALLFNGSFFRVGPDLYIVNDAAANFRVPDYFAWNEAPDLTDPNGAVLRGDLVERLAGPIAPGQYAQTGEIAAAGPIGQVETAEGGVSVQRVDGTVEALQIGAKVYQNDVLSTSDDGAVSVTFVDGTIFTLSASSRMVIDELIYDPEAADNSGSFSLIQGSFVFIAGQVAKTGGMDVNTPSSTMGIRGTTVVVQVGTNDGVDTTEVSLTTDPDGAQGRVELRDLDGNLVALITQTDTKWIVSAATGETREVERSLLDEAEDNLLIAEAFAAYRSAISRVDAGDSFVSAPNTAANSGDPTAGETAPADLDIDGLDDPGGIQSPPPVAEPGEDGEGDTFDEGLNTPLNGEEPTVVVVSGPEDASEEDAIDGDVSTVASLAGTVFALQTGPSNGGVVIDADGQFNYVPDPDFNGTDSFTFVATDPLGEVTTGTVIVQVLPVNDAPEASDTAATVSEDGTLTGVIAARDVDGDTLDFTIAEVPVNGELTLFSNGTYSYQPGPDFVGTDSFSVTVTDPLGETAQSTVTVTVTALNDAPVITSVISASRGAVTEGTTIATATGQLTATDPDENDTVQWSGGSTGVFGTFVISAAGAWTYMLDNAAADRIAEGETVVETFTAVANDTLGAETTETVEVTITGTNDAPIVTPNSVFETDQNGVLEALLIAEDADSSGALTFAAGNTGPANGTVMIAADGSFTYTPEPGFVGVDRFNYTVMDANGGVSTAWATAAVEAASGGPGDQTVMVSLNTEATPETSAGALVIDIAPGEMQSVNLVIAMDSSGSIGPVNWAAQREAVKDAVALLAEQFENTSVTVDVKIVAYSGRTNTVGPYDLQDPDLPDAILDLPYLRGATAWNLAFDEARTFFEAEPEGEANYMLLITDGTPSNGLWRDALEALTNPPGAGYTVDIQAFGIGNKFNPTFLQEIDPDPTLLNSAEDLAGALPGFLPSLIRLDVTLEVDGQDVGTIATETSEALVLEGIDYELPLASIENIAALLGESNRISVSAEFDLDGDDSTAEVELFSTDVIGKADEAQNVTGLQGADLLFGSDLADDIRGGEGDDVILGFDGADTLDGGAGADVVLAGAGDDVLRVTEAADSGQDVLDGGTGRDVVQIDMAGDLNDLMSALDLRDVEAIDMDNGAANTLELTLADVVDLSSTSDSELESLLDAALPESAVIYGDTTDSLTLVGTGDGAFQKVSSAPVEDGNGNTLDIYAYVEDGNVLATLGVDTDIEVSGAVPVG